MTKILLIEDNEMNRDMLSRRLEMKGFEVIIALDGAEGVTKARSETPDLILMDINLPVMNGLEATKLLKRSAETKTIPIIILTAHAMDSDRERGFEEGCDAYETKPLDLPHLLETVERLVQANSSGKQLRAE